MHLFRVCIITACAKGVVVADLFVRNLVVLLLFLFSFPSFAFGGERSYFYYNEQYRVYFFRKFIEINMMYEGVSYDVVDVGNYHKGKFYGTMWGMTYGYYTNVCRFEQVSVDKFRTFSYDDILDLFYACNYDMAEKYNMGITSMYLYVFYIFFSTKYNFLYDCASIYEDFEDCLENDDKVFLVLLKKKLEKRMSVWIKKNPVYANGLRRKYYNYYNDCSRYIFYACDMRPNAL